MSEYNFYEIFPTSIATALHRAFGSYLVKNGVAVRHPNGFEELLVSYQNIDEVYPDHYPKFFEGFRDVVSTDEPKDVTNDEKQTVDVRPKRGRKPKSDSTSDVADTTDQSKDVANDVEEQTSDNTEVSNQEQGTSTDATQTEEETKPDSTSDVAVSVDPAKDVVNEDIKQDTPQDPAPEGNKSE